MAPASVLRRPVLSDSLVPTLAARHRGGAPPRTGDAKVGERDRRDPVPVLRMRPRPGPEQPVDEHRVVVPRAEWVDQLRPVLKEYVELLEQTGDARGAQRMSERLAALP